MQQGKRWLSFITAVWISCVGIATHFSRNVFPEYTMLIWILSLTVAFLGTVTSFNVPKRWLSFAAVWISCVSIATYLSRNIFPEYTIFIWILSLTAAFLGTATSFGFSWYEEGVIRFKEDYAELQGNDEDVKDRFIGDQKARAVDRLNHLADYINRPTRLRAYWKFRKSLQMIQQKEKDVDTLEILHEDMAPLQHVRDVPIIRAATPRTTSDADMSDDPEFSLEDSGCLVDDVLMRALSNSFPFLDQEVIETLARTAEIRELKAGQKLFSIGSVQKSPSLHLLKTGRIRIELDEDPKRPQLLQLSGQGHILEGLYGLLAMLTGAQIIHQTTATAEVDCEVYTFASETTVKLFHVDYPQALPQMIRLSTIRMHQVILLTVSQTIGVQRDLYRTEEQCPESASPKPVPATEATQEAMVVAVSRFLEIDAELLPDLAVASEKHSDNNTSEFQLVTLKNGQRLFSAGDAPALYVVVRGRVDLTMPAQTFSSKPTSTSSTTCTSSFRSSLASRRAKAPSLVRRVSAVGSLGYLHVITREAMTYDASSSSPEGTVVVRLAPELFDHLVTKDSALLQTTTKHFLQQLSPLVQQLDYAISWVNALSGELVVHAGDICESMLVVLCGRLRDQNQREYGTGATLGAFEVISGEPQSVTVRAVRYTELACVPRSVFSICSRKRPQVFASLCRNIVAQQHETGERKASVDHHSMAVIPLSKDVPLDYFCDKLEFALSKLGTVLVQDSSLLKNQRSMADQHLCSEMLRRKFARLEQQRSFLIFKVDDLHEASSNLTDWACMAAAGADLVLFVAMAANDPALTKVEEQLKQQQPINAEKNLILLHPQKDDRDGVIKSRARSNSSSNDKSYDDKNKDNDRFGDSLAARKMRTREWIALRSVQRHYHIRYHPQREVKDVIFKSDFNRLARYLTGNAIGVVLGGGGARGMCHIGVLRALEESGIPVDVIGGTSIGSFIGGAYAADDDFLKLHRRARPFARAASSTWRMLMDLTLPLVSYLTGAGFDYEIVNLFREFRIEDLWLPYYCITTDLTQNCERVHRNGSLWRFVSASMRLIGYMPPMCVTERLLDGNKRTHYLVDGGYTNNLPADVMAKDPRVSTVISVDVASRWDFTGFNYGNRLSGWSVCWNKLAGWVSSLTCGCYKVKRFPGHAEISSQLMYVCNDQHFDQVMKDTDLYIRPDTSAYGLLDFHKFAELVKKGHAQGQADIAEWKTKPSGKKLFKLLKKMSRKNSKQDRGNNKQDPLRSLRTLHRSSSFTSMSATKF